MICIIKNNQEIPDLTPEFFSPIKTTLHT